MQEIHPVKIYASVADNAHLTEQDHITKLRVIVGLDPPLAAFSKAEGGFVKVIRAAIIFVMRRDFLAQGVAVEQHAQAKAIDTVKADAFVLIR